MFDLATGTATNFEFEFSFIYKSKVTNNFTPSITNNTYMLPNINRCENGLSNFSENLRIVAIKLCKLTRFLSLNLSIYFNFVRCWWSVVMLTFLNLPPVSSPLIEKSMATQNEVKL